MPAEDWSLSVGINAYPGIGPLQGAEADAREFHAWATDPAGGGVNPARAKLILSQASNSGRVRDAMPARHHIEDFFVDVDDAANANDVAGEGFLAGRRLYLFFSGHGFAPSFDGSAVLMANATRTLLDNFACRLWANQLFQGGWFKEILLFQDACRGRVSAGTLMPSFLAIRNAPGEHRFYALSGPDGQLALEKPDAHGVMRGVFSMTLMDGLRGHARDPQTGAITSQGLYAYLHDNMRAKYCTEDLAREDVAKWPDIYSPVPFDIVPGHGAALSFPVRITLQGGAADAKIVDSGFNTVECCTGRIAWDTTLPRGFYELKLANGASTLFQVTGALSAQGKPEMVHVNL